MNQQALKEKLTKSLNARYDYPYISETRANMRRHRSKEADIRFKINYKGVRDKYYNKFDEDESRIEYAGLLSHSNSY